jgi:hypothetical protein
MRIELKDWDVLAAEWRDQSSPPEQKRRNAAQRLRRRVRRHTWYQRLELAGEIVLTICYIAWGASLFAEPDGRGVLPALAIYGMTAFVWSFVIWSRRGSWRPLGENTREYVRLSYARVRSARLSIRFAGGVILASLLFYVPWFVIRLNRGAIHGAEWWRWGFLAVYVTAFLGWCSWRAVRIRHELELLGEVERELGEAEG